MIVRGSKMDNAIIFDQLRIKIIPTKVYSEHNKRMISDSECLSFQLHVTPIMGYASLRKPHIFGTLKATILILISVIISKLLFN